MNYIGIDPGLDGAIACLNNDIGPLVTDTPTGTDGKGRIYMVAEMFHQLQRYTTGGDPTKRKRTIVFIEKVHSMPKQGVKSTFTFGMGYGYWIALCVAMSLPYELVTPQAWKRVTMSGRQKDKDASRARAQELFPTMVSQLNLKKHHGRADALLIAEYGRRTAPAVTTSTIITADM